MRRYRILLGLGLLLVGCGYGKVTPTTYELAMSLYNISNRQLTDHLDEAKDKIEAALENDEISSKEAKWLHAIHKRAEQKQWQQAMKSARQIMEDQITK